jgi:selenide, water dikinase
MPMSIPAKFRLTDYAKCAGCAGKIAPGLLAEVLRGLPGRPLDPNLLVGTETCDDAGVYRVSDDLALVQTLDFFPPLVDDPSTFGRIAATNALSDIYAMNGRPLTAMNIVGFPDAELDLSILGEILRGAGEVVTAAGAVTVGGHSLRDAEVKFGLSVTGLVNPAEVVTNAGAKVGDILVLTKPLGTGFVTTAAKKGECPPEVLERAVASMTTLNAIGRDAWRAAGGASAATDVTGFGLAGHATEMAEGARLTIAIDVAKLPRIEGTEALANPTFHTRATKTNRSFVAPRLRIEPSADALGLEYAFDAQTSGGLLIAIAPDRVDRLLAELALRRSPAAAVVGRVLDRDGELALILR